MWEAIWNGSSAIATVVAAVLTALALWAQRGSKAAAAEAAAQAQAAINAAERAATAQERAVLAQEQAVLAQQSAAQAEADAARAQERTAADVKRLADMASTTKSEADLKPWRLVVGGGGSLDWWLQNTTKTPKYFVRLEGEPVRGEDGNSFDIVDGDESVELDVITYMGVDYRMTIYWYATADRAGPELSQRASLKK